MKHRVTIDIQEIIDKAEAQSANDFRAMRVQNGKVANEVFDDFVFVADNRELVLSQIDFAAKVIRTKLYAHLGKFESTPEAIYMEIAVPECRVDESLEAVITDFLTATLLSWWYTLRNSDLSTLYAQRAVDDIDEAVHLITPKFTTRRCRLY